ncbi:MAG: hemerythrin domain-containing protein, partial [Burkholderiaceae bacterium]|nr:hemerythrin domain-containing protein [Burkholderiaceae bacterium]
MSSISLRTIREEHASLAAVLQSLRLMLDQGPGDEPAAFFDVMRAMLFYIDEFPERQHHPKESRWLFPKVAERSPEAAKAIAQLEREHVGGEAAVRELQHLLLGWELMGDGRREAFADALQRYVRFYLDHMRLEETVVLPAAQLHFQQADWVAVDAAFASNTNPLA